MEKTNITTIGKIILDERFYEGVDRYSDGDIEDELLKMVETHDRKAFRKLTEEKNNWPVLYHLSPFRENIAEWIPIQKNEKVLEVGSGCGAITGALAKKAGKVVGVDLSKKRSTINANRLKDADNVELRIGNFLDVEKDLPDDFDVIMLIGVFEYAAGYIGGEHPYEEFLKILKKHLKSGGRMFIAIENLFGLKYFAGCREDHAGRYFEGIEGYPKKGVARTFSENGLKRIFESVGLPQYRFYYPYPDYKFPHTIFSKECFPKKGELHDNIRNFDRERMILFDETKAFDTIIDDGEFPLFSNSYLVVIGEAPDIAMVKYSVDRDEAYGICTTIEGLKTQKKVIKRAMSEKAVGHIDNIEKAYRALTERFAGSGISFNRLERIDDKRIELEFVEGITLEELLDQKLQRGDKEGFLSLFDRYSGIVSYHTEAAVCDYDLIFQNIIVKGDVWTVIDYEWTFFESMDPKEIILRALWCYIQGNENRKIVKEWCCPGTDFGDVVRKEQEFQKKVQGGHPALSEIRHAIGKAATSPKALNRAHLPSITGMPASGPMSPRPSTAVPSVMTATRLCRRVRLKDWL